MTKRREFLLQMGAAGIISTLPTVAAAQQRGHPIPPAPPAGNWLAQVSLSNQEMALYRDGQLQHRWPVSTARSGKVTPRGEWRPYWLSRNHRSSLYNNAPMPYSVFYSGNYAVHGTNQEHLLGQRASAGCVRLATQNAALVYAIAHHHGLGSLLIRVGA